MMDDDDDIIRSIVSEILGGVEWQKASAEEIAVADAAARLILAARRERDCALDRETDWENEHIKLSQLHDDDVVRLTAERDTALATIAKRDAEWAARMRVLQEENKGWETLPDWSNEREAAARNAALEARVREQTERYETNLNEITDEHLRQVALLDARIAALEAKLAAQTKRDAEKG